MLDILITLGTDPPVVLYFAALGWSIYYCFRKSSKAAVVLSLAIMSVTWLYIIQYTADYLRSGKTNLFDDAYADVVQSPHYTLSSQLLTWVVVAVAWSHTASTNYLLFGMLGAMSASFVTWLSSVPVPVSAESRRVPVGYFVCSVLSLLCIAMLPRTLASPNDFSLWLRGLHVMLVLPKFLPKYLNASVDGTLFYALLAVAIAAWHNFSGLSAPQWPQTACQISIECDLLLCAAVTLYAVYAHTRSVAATAIAACLTPLLSPGSVLAGFLALAHFPAAHCQLVSSMQASVAAKLLGEAEGESGQQDGGSQWANLGLWETGEGDESYAAACERLALRLARAASIGKGDGVLAVGCGAGAELYLYKALGAKHVTGLEPGQEAVRGFSPQLNVRLLQGSAAGEQGMRARFLAKGSSAFNKVLALDNCYHYSSKRQFFRDAFHMLPSGGQVAVTDLVVKNPLPVWLKLVLRACNIPFCNMWSSEHYVQELQQAGYEAQVTFDRLGPRVLERWLPAAALEYLDYAVVVATVPRGRTRASGGRAGRKKVAIIGSGLSGLATASKLSQDYDVTVFEAGDRIGLSGNCATFHGTTMDLPLRMIGQNYYNKVEGLLREVEVPTVRARTDCQFYGSSGPQGFSYYKARSLLSNLLRALPHLSSGLRLARAVSDPKNALMSKTETWGSWMKRNGFSEEQEGQDKAMWMMMGQMSWVLSCTFQHICEYPAHIILGFVKSLDLSLWGMIQDDGRYVVRADPSIDAAAHALAYGCEFKFNQRVKGLDGGKRIDGERFDAVVVATEASAVQHIMRNPPSCFGKFEYEPSSIVLHSDPSLMPAKRGNWCALNVCSDAREEMSMLSVWMNVYYPESEFPVDIFQTWNPLHAPKGGVLKEQHFTRVLHSSKTPALLELIEAEQGKGGVFFAGSYAVYGMGLLEQAATSGMAAADLVKKYLKA